MSIQMQQGANHSIHSATLADVLERILDKGLVIAGDIKIKLVDIELLTIQIRLVVCSVEQSSRDGHRFLDDEFQLQFQPAGSRSAIGTRRAAAAARPPRGAGRGRAGIVAREMTMPSCQRAHSPTTIRSSK